MHVSFDPVQVFEGRSRVCCKKCFVVLAADGAAFQVEGAVNVFMRREKVVHYDEMYFAAIRHLDAVKAVELTEKGVRILLNVLVVIAKDLSKEFGFVMVNGFDYVFVVARKVEEAAGFARRSELGEDVFLGQRHEIVCGIDAEDGSQMAEDSRCIVFEFKVVSCSWREFGAETVELKFVFGGEVGIGEVALDLCIGTGHAESDSGQHVIRRLVVAVSFGDFGPHDHAIFVFFEFSSLLAAGDASLFDALSPDSGIFVLGVSSAPEWLFGGSRRGPSSGPVWRGGSRVEKRAESTSIWRAQGEARESAFGRAIGGERGWANCMAIGGARGVEKVGRVGGGHLFARCEGAINFIYDSFEKSLLHRIGVFDAMVVFDLALVVV